MEYPREYREIVMGKHIIYKQWVILQRTIEYRAVIVVVRQCFFAMDISYNSNQMYCSCRVPNIRSFQ